MSKRRKPKQCRAQHEHKNANWQNLLSATRFVKRRDISYKPHSAAAAAAASHLSYLDPLIGNLGVDFHDRLNKIVDHFTTLLVANLLDIVEFLLRVLLGLLLGGLVA